MELFYLEHIGENQILYGRENGLKENIPLKKEARRKLRKIWGALKTMFFIFFQSMRLKLGQWLKSGVLKNGDFQVKQMGCMDDVGVKILDGLTDRLLKGSECMPNHFGRKSSGQFMAGMGIDARNVMHLMGCQIASMLTISSRGLAILEVDLFYQTL